MKALTCVFATILISIAVALPYAHNSSSGERDDLKAPPATVTEIDFPSYLGRWYQMYANIIVNRTYEKDQVCVTADYGLFPNGTISVLNSGRLKTVDGALTQISGNAFIKDPTKPGQLGLTFPSVPVPGDYWILKLGPMEETFPWVPQYQYSIVSTPRRSQLFILARDPEEFRKRFDAEVLAFLKDDGFTTIVNRPLETFQSSKCKYYTP